MAKKKSDIEKESLDSYLDRQYGKGVVLKASELVQKPKDILPTVLSLDIALSGGIPEGTVVLLTGRPKSGKSTLCLQLIRNAISDKRPAYYFNIERRCSPSLIKTIDGLNPENFNIIQPPDGVVFTAEQWLDVLEKVVKEQKRSLIIVDSLAMLSTLAEQSENIGDNKDMSGAPKLMSSFSAGFNQS